MSDCAYCDVIKKKHKVVYEDEFSYAMFVTKPAAAGHLVLLPKTHVPILEEVPDHSIGHMFAIANKLSTSCFQALGAEGTNIIVQNGPGAGQTHNHFLMHIIPRRQNDGIDFTWQPRQIPEDEMGTIALRILEETKNIGVFEKAATLVKEAEKVEEVGEQEQYLIDQLERLP
jgi:histidine triad (HIT) family protein